MGRDENMKIIYDENEQMNHHELKLVYHPKNKKLAQLLLKQFTENLGEVELYDEYHNKYYVPLLAIYYFEMVDQKFYAYTEKRCLSYLLCENGTLKTAGTGLWLLSD